MKLSNALIGRRFGLVRMLDVLEHLPDPVAALRLAWCAAAA